jgi:hypothetical protein
MKSCPQCNRTFEDTLTFCLIDGSILSAPFDPHATLASPEPGQTEPQLIETLKFDEDIQEIPTIIRSPQPKQQPEELASTMIAPAPAFESPQLIDSTAPPARKSNRLPLIIGALATFLIIGAAVFILANRTDSIRQNPIKENAVTVNTAANYSTSPTRSNSANSRVTADSESSSSNSSANTTARGSGMPPSRPSPASTPKAPPIPSRSVQPSGKDRTVAAKPAEPDINDSAAPCANKAYQVCEPNETRRCNAATGKWECRRSR